MKQTVFTVAVTALIVVVAFFGIAYLWADAGVHLSRHGWIAYALGCIFSFALAGGLFFLTFKSSRDGYDDIARPQDISE